MLWNWFGLKRSAESRRGIFVYRDGTRKRRADPVAVEQAMIDALGEDWRKAVRRLDQPPAPLGVVGEQAQAASAEWEANHRKVMAAIDAAFGVRPLDDEGGLTEVERMGLLTGYLNFCVDLILAARPFANARSRASPSPEPPPAPSRPGLT